LVAADPCVADNRIMRKHGDTWHEQEDLRFGIDCCAVSGALLVEMAAYGQAQPVLSQTSRSST